MNARSLSPRLQPADEKALGAIRSSSDRRALKGWFRYVIVAACFAWTSSAHAAVETWDLVERYRMKSSDAKPAIDEALSDAKRYLNKNPNNELVLYLPPGTWNVIHPSSDGIEIRGFSKGKLTLRGQSKTETVLNFSQYDRDGILINESEQITISNMHLTRPQLYTTQGDVISVDSNGSKLVLDIHDGFPDPIWLFERGDNHERVLVPFEGSDLSPYTSGISPKIHIADVKSVGGNRFEFSIRGKASDLARELSPGNRLAMKCKVGAATIFGTRSHHCIFEDLLITNSSRDGIWMRSSNDQIVRRIEISRGEPINGKLPFFSQPADGIHLWATTEKGRNLLVEDCVIVGTADDGIAVIITVGGAENFVDFVENIVVRNNLVVMGLARSIIVNWADGAQIYGNRVTSISMSGLRLEGVINSEIRDNEFVSNPSGFAIHLSNHADFAKAGGNRIFNNTFAHVNKEMHLILIDSANNTQVNKNVITSFSEMKGFKSGNEVNPAPLFFAVDSQQATGTNFLKQNTTMPKVGSKGSEGITVDWTR